MGMTICVPIRNRWKCVEFEVELFDFRLGESPSRTNRQYVRVVVHSERKSAGLILTAETFVTR